MPNFPTSLASNASMLVAADFRSSPLRGTGAGAAPMTNSQNTVPVTDATQFPDPAGATYYATLEAVTPSAREIFSYTGLDLTVGANALTGVIRHLFGTNTTTHPIGATCELDDMSQYHELLKNEIIAVQTKVGITSSADNTSFDYKLAQVATGDRAVSLTGAQTLTNKTLTAPTMSTVTVSTGGITVTAGDIVATAGDMRVTAGRLVFAGTSQKIVPSTTSLLIRNAADNATNFTLTDAGAFTTASTITVTAGGVTVTAGGVTVTAGGLIVNGGGATLNAGNMTFGGSNQDIIGSGTQTRFRDALNANSNIVIADAGTVTISRGPLVLGAAAARIVGGATSLALRDNANANDNLLVTDAGAVTVRNALTVTAGAFTMGATASQIVAGATSISLRNNANSLDNVLVTDAGVVTIRTSVTAPTVAATTAMTLAGAPVATQAFAVAMAVAL